MADVSVPPVKDLVGDLPIPPAPRVATHDWLADVELPKVAGNRWLRPVVDVAASLTALAVASAVAPTVQPAVLLSVALAWPLLLAGNGWYARRPLGEPIGIRLGRVLRAGATLGVACWVAGLVFGTAVAPEATVPDVAMLTLAVLLTGLVPLPGETTTRIVLAGHSEDIRSAMTELSTSRRYVVTAAACVTAPPTEPLDGVPVQVGVSSAAEVAVRSKSDALLLLPGPELTPAMLRRLEWGAESVGVPLYVGTGLLDVAPNRVSVVQGAGLDVMQVRAAPARGPRRLVKDAVERVVAALALVVLAPLLVLVWALVRAESTGPGLFRQQRVGRGGTEFTMVKFRTMTTAAEKDLARLAELNQVEGGVLFKIRSDPRITPWGARLRRYSLDELPQLWNVVRGEMSLVGPRPALPQEVERYDADSRRRLAVKPGLTGLWQVSGRSDLSWAESVRLDLRYVDNWSLALDVAIVCRTVRAVLSHRGAY